MSTMLMSQRNRTTVEWWIEDAPRRKDRRLRRAVKRSERQSWRRNVWQEVTR